MPTHRIDRKFQSTDAPPAQSSTIAPPTGAPPRPETDLDLEARLSQFEEPPDWAPRAGRRTFRAKAAAGLRGLKHAFRGDSSFFAHAYRALLMALAAALLGVGPLQWIILALAVGLVLIAEFAHSAIDTLARSFGDPDAPGPTAAREIATAGVLVAVVVYAAAAVTILTLRFIELLRL